ncbi:hypothetical protein ARMGADRAFT_1035688 [Armillaria gallica]|uniref:Uncharacterized protein n=1 Tax=Armillaria gallica TaxID=47427 RepID=A0A2H3CXN0_ARMGA|nr:hypothetical protein ARMGADRAFT_1035688 [Armillaria gallica]
MNSGSGLGSMEFGNDAMSISAEVKEISTDSGEGATRKSTKEIADLEAKQMVEVKKWQQQIETCTMVYEVEIEELHEHTKQKSPKQNKLSKDAKHCIVLYKEQLKGNHDEAYQSKIDYSQLNADTTCELSLAQHYEEHPSFIWSRPIEVLDNI